MAQGLCQLFAKLVLLVCVSGYGSVPVSAGNLEAAVGSSGAGVQVVVNHVTWVLGTQLGSPEVQNWFKVLSHPSGPLFGLLSALGQD